MADIELVIRIPEELFSELDEEDYQSTISWYDTTLYCAIKNGTPLPKGHGKLVILSEDKLKENQINLDFSCQKWISEVGLSNATVATIETDEADKENKK